MGDVWMPLEMDDGAGERDGEEEEEGEELKKTQAAQAREKQMASKQAKTRDTDPDKDGARTNT